MSKNVFLPLVILVVVAYYWTQKKMSDSRGALEKIEMAAVANGKVIMNRGVATDKLVMDLGTKSKRELVANKVVLDSQILESPMDLSIYPESTQKKIMTLQEILLSKNDNDPRLDTEFQNLTVEDKVALKDFYGRSKKEKLNERGTLVYLMGRDLNSSEDMSFLKSVISEKPCLSFVNCTKILEGDEKVGVGANPVEEISLSYPQQVVLESVSRLIREKESKGEISSMDESLRKDIVGVLDAGKSSDVPSLKRKSLLLLQKINL